MNSFKIAQRVWIIELEVWGTVLALFEDGLGKQYRIRYFWNGDPKDVYFYAAELSGEKT